MTTAIVNKSTMKIESRYPGAAKQNQYSGPWGNSLTHAHVEWDETVEGNSVKAQDDGQGGLEVVADLQAARNAKLALMRKTRDEKLPEVDVMCNELAVGERTDASAVKVYRASLLNMTDSYKDSEDPEQGTDSLDNLEDDLSDVMWPTKP